MAVAVQDRWLSAAQGDALRRTLGVPRALELAPAWREAALELIDDCWSGQWTPEDLARAARRFRASLDSLAAVREAEQLRALRSFTRHVHSSGLVHYDIDLDPESDARFYGPTCDGVLPCKRQHLMLHNHGARVERCGSQYWLLWPGRDPIRLHSKAGIRAQLRLLQPAPSAMSAVESRLEQ